ncbi:hypothetical protein V1514DRAFT_331690 [Lipomyces japonicus]|uniref:uncharacterized protein n=1 Tax=Lipomyces japonicus TaxID=56871 RepID=UPI0034CE3530
MQRSLRTVRSAPSLRAQYLHSSASTPNPSNLLSKTASAYKNLTVENLRKECRNRGLKVSGNKSNLVNRLIVDDASPFSTTANQTRELNSPSSKILNVLSSPLTVSPQNAERKSIKDFVSPMKAVRSLKTTVVGSAKGDNSTIEYYKLPDPSIFVEHDSLPPIPVIPDNYTTRTIIPDEPPAARPEINHLSGDNLVQPIEDTVDNVSVEEANSGQYKNQEELQPRDRIFLLSFLAGTLGWWSFKSLKLTPDKE